MASLSQGFDASQASLIASDEAGHSDSSLGQRMGSLGPMADVCRNDIGDGIMPGRRQHRLRFASRAEKGGTVCIHRPVTTGRKRLGVTTSDTAGPMGILPSLRTSTR